jgi:hypothetical protein
MEVPMARRILNRTESYLLHVFVEKNKDEIKKYRSWKDVASFCQSALKFPITEFNVQPVANRLGVYLQEVKQPAHNLTEADVRRIVAETLDKVFQDRIAAMLAAAK